MPRFRGTNGIEIADGLVTTDSLVVDRMNNTALQHDWFEPPEKSHLQIVASVESLPDSSSTIYITALTCTLIALQILDGILTTCGVITFGSSSEGNPLLTYLIQHVGVIPALLIAKGLCIGLVFFLHAQAQSMKWISFALVGIAGFYTCTAILPWSYLLVHALL